MHASAVIVNFKYINSLQNFIRYLLAGHRWIAENKEQNVVLMKLEWYTERYYGAAESSRRSYMSVFHRVPLDTLAL